MPQYTTHPSVWNTNATVAIPLLSNTVSMILIVIRRMIRHTAIPHTTTTTQSGLQADNHIPVVAITLLLSVPLHPCPVSLPPATSFDATTTRRVLRAICTRRMAQSSGGRATFSQAEGTARGSKPSRSFTCSLCQESFRVDYRGRKPPFCPQLVFMEDVFCMKDPFSVGGEEGGNVRAPCSRCG